MTTRPHESATAEKDTSSTARLQILPVGDKAARREFLHLPGSLYAHDPAWIPPLLLERRVHLSKNNPYFEHATFQAWIARRGTKTVGRISAQVDQLHLQRYDDHTGFFGMLEAQDDPEVFQTLFDTAQAWLRERGMKHIRGPFNFSINQECGLLVEGFDTPPVIMMGHALPYYSRRIEEQGFTAEQDLLAYCIGSDFAAPRQLESLNSRVAGQVRLRPMRRREFTEDLAILKDIFEDAWANNWGFLPFTTEEFNDLGKSLKLFVPTDFVRIAEVDGEPAAMMVVFPNLNEAIRDLDGRLFPLGWLKLLWRLKVSGVKTGRVPLMGVRQRYQGNRLGAILALLLITSLQDSVRRRGLEEVEASWILENNIGMRAIIESIGGKSYKRYRIYRKDFACARDPLS
jgi:hypothetical protein